MAAIMGGDIGNWQMECPQCNKTFSMKAPIVREIDTTIEKLRLRTRQHCCQKHSQGTDPWDVIRDLQPTLYTLDWSRKRPLLRSPSPPSPWVPQRPSRSHSRSPTATEQLNHVQQLVERIRRRNLHH